jgi:MoxR-like ATPase
MPRTKIHNGSETHDSRDIIERIEALQEARQDWIEQGGDIPLGSPEWAAATNAWAVENGEDAAELEALQRLAEEAEGYAADWHHGEVLIRDDYFTDYTRELLEDCGMIPRDLPSWVEIDWEATARNVRTDYTAVDFDGVTYWIR